MGIVTRITHTHRQTHTVHVCVCTHNTQTPNIHKFSLYYFCVFHNQKSCAFFLGLFELVHVMTQSRHHIQHSPFLNSINCGYQFFLLGHTNTAENQSHNFENCLKIANNDSFFFSLWHYSIQGEAACPQIRVTSIRGFHHKHFNQHVKVFLQW